MNRAGTLLVLFLFSLVNAASQDGRPTARQIIERIHKNANFPARAQTVDTFKAGNPDTPVTGIATTMMATYEVLEKAAAAGKNLIITHEPTFYTHQEKTDDLEKENDAVFRAKQAFIEAHHLVVWRFHDLWHDRPPDGIEAGMIHALGWEKFQNPSDNHLFAMPAITLDKLAADAKRRLAIRIVRVVGDPALKVTKVGLMPGAAGSLRHRHMLQRDDVEVLVIGEAPEWETVEYVADAVAEGKHKALIILGHIPSEQAGMEECARWLKTFITDVPVDFIAASEPFWMPKN